MCGLHFDRAKFFRLLFWLPLSASVWPVTQPRVCAVCPETKPSSSGSATRSCNKSVKSVSRFQADLLPLLLSLIWLVCMSDSFLQRTHRHELFTPPTVGAAVEEGRNKFQVSQKQLWHWKWCLFLHSADTFFPSQLKTVEALLGSSAKLGEVIILGMVTQLKEVS